MKNIEIARKLEGIKEVKGKNLNFTDNKNYTGKEFYDMLKSVGWKRGWAYCALTAKLVWKMAGYPDVNLFSANSQKTFKNFKNSGKYKITDYPVVGAMPIYRYKGGVHGHVDICVTKVLNDKEYYAIGGNVSNQVKETKRKLGSVKNRVLMGFVWNPEMTENTGELSDELEQKIITDCEAIKETAKKLNNLIPKKK